MFFAYITALRTNLYAATFDFFVNETSPYRGRNSGDEQERTPSRITIWYLLGPASALVTKDVLTARRTELPASAICQIRMMKIHSARALAKAASRCTIFIDTVIHFWRLFLDWLSSIRALGLVTTKSCRSLRESPYHFATNGDEKQDKLPFWVSSITSIPVNFQAYGCYPTISDRPLYCHLERWTVVTVCLPANIITSNVA